MPRSGVPARGSCAPARRSRSATRWGCAPSTTRSGARSTRPVRPASRAAARRRPAAGRGARAARAAVCRRPGQSAGRRVDAAMRFKQSPDPAPPGRAANGLAALRSGAGAARDADRDRDRPRALALALAPDEVPEPVAGGWSRVSGALRALVSAEPGSQLSVFAEAGGHDAELVVLVVRHRATGWVREIARKDEDSHDRGRVRARDRDRHGLRGPARVQGARAGRPPGGSRRAPRPRVRPVPDARGRGGRERRLLVGRRTDPRTAAARRATRRSGRVRRAPSASRRRYSATAPTTS